VWRISSRAAAGTGGFSASGVADPTYQIRTMSALSMSNETTLSAFTTWSPSRTKVLVAMSGSTQLVCRCVVSLDSATALEETRNAVTALGKGCSIQGLLRDAGRPPHRHR
jgi:hypothetical protein